MLDLTDSSNTTSNKGITTAVELEQLRNEGKTLTLQELKELNTRVKALEEMARIEDRLRLLENRNALGIAKSLITLDPLEAHLTLLYSLPQN